MIKRIFIVSIICLAALLTLTVSLGMAQTGTIDQSTQRNSSESDTPDEATSRSSYIPVQGRLTDAGGNPLTGTYLMDFKVYETEIGGSSLCQELDRAVNVANGLFTSYMYLGNCDAFDGRLLYLGITVENDSEMFPRQYIDNVPYAWSLRPGANVVSDISNPLLVLNNTADGEGLWAVSTYSEAVHAYSGSSIGVSANSINGTGLYANSMAGLAIEAVGTGIIASTAPSYLWISGSGIQPYQSTDSTVITMDTIGGAWAERGATAGTKYVMLPVTIPGVLYGQNVTISAIDIYWVGETEFDSLTNIRVRLQTGGVCPSCYHDLLYDSTAQICNISNYPTGCVAHYDLTTNNVLSPTAGIIHIGFGLSFSGSSTYVDIGGVRLTLEYHD